MAEPRIGIVIIGRNEGERLMRCISSVQTDGVAVVYVDSGSQDGSVVCAQRRGVDVIALDPAQPFTAARGRNEGFRFLSEKHPGMNQVQFVDGDVEMAAGWIAAGRDALDADAGLAVVTGRLRERHPEASVYNRLCDLEWDRPVGAIAEFGGNAMHRVSALAGTSLFDPTLIAGEEPELAARLAGQGWRFARIDAEMGSHDAAMTDLGQWWKRALRAGHAYAEVNALHPEFWKKEVRSNWMWGGVAATGLALAPVTLGASGAVALAGYGVLARRLKRGAHARGRSRDDAELYARYTALSKIPAALGQAKYWWGRVRRQRSGLIEYKK